VRGDPQFELDDVVLVGRRLNAPEPGSSSFGDIVSVTGLAIGVGDNGISVVGPRPGLVHTLEWARIISVDLTAYSTFENGSPARSLYLVLDDRRVQFLVRPEQLPAARLDELVTLLRRYLTPGVTVLAPESPAAPASAAVAPVRPAAVAPVRPAAVGPAVAPPAQVAGRGSTEPRIYSPGRRMSLPPPPPRANVSMPPAPSQAASSVERSQAAPPFPTPSQLSAPQNAPPHTTEETTLGAVVSTPRSSTPIQRTVGGLINPIAVPQARLVAASTEDTASSSRPSEDPTSRPQTPTTPLPIPANAQTSPEWQGDLGDPNLAQSPGLYEPGPASGEPGEEPRSGADESDETEPGSGSQGADPKHRPQRRRRRIVGTGFSLMAILVVGGVVGFIATTSGGTSNPTADNQPGVSTKSSSGGSSVNLQGPGQRATAGPVASVLNLDLAEFPPGWHLGRLSPWSRVPTAQANKSLAGCIGLPASDVSILTAPPPGNASGLYSSDWVSQSGQYPRAFQSTVELFGSPSVPTRDLAALSGPKAARCLQGWFGSLDRNRDQIVGVPSVTAFRAPAVRGEKVAAFHATVLTEQSGLRRTVHEDLLVLASGRIEVAVVGEEIGAGLSSPLETSVLSGLENRLFAEASS
jgi:hypothetical protein